MRNRILMGALTAACLASAAHADIVLQDGNSLARIDPLSAAGMYHWDVQGQNQLVQQWFWFRAGSMTSELPINALNAAPVINLGTGPTQDRYVSTLYDDGVMGVRIEYLLTGGTAMITGQTATADIAETITLYNHSTSPLSFHFFQYSDFNLNGAAADTTQIFPVGTRFILADQWDNTGSQLSESQTTVLPLANHGEANFAGITLASLNDLAPTTLNDVLTPVGPGDTTWAMQWDLTIPAATVMGPGAIIISKDKLLNVVILPNGGNIPEPASLALVGCGAVALLARRRRS
jgi:hypothetical protein